MVRKNELLAEDLVKEAEGLGAEELVEGKLKFGFTPRKVPKEKRDVKKISKREEKPLTKKDIRILLKKQKIQKVKKLPQRPQFDVSYSREQMMLRSMFGGGVGKNILLMEHERRPQILGALRSGGGIIKSNDNNETADLMGFNNQGGFFVKNRPIQRKKRGGII